MQIADKKIALDQPVFVIAEIGSNHDCKREQARLLIDKCASIGVDAVKFQSFNAETLVRAGHPAMEVLRRLSLSDEWHSELAAYCRSKKIIFLSTPFDEEKVDLLDKLKVPAYKIASGDLTYYRLLEKVAATGKPVLLATGIATLEEVKSAVNVLEKNGCRELAILHCVSNYPPRLEDENLLAVETLKEAFPKYIIGLSDHSPGYVAPLGAVTLGARIIEKHITISRELQGPDHPYALEVDEFALMIKNIRVLEKMLGTGKKQPAQAELPDVIGARRGIYLKKNIKKSTVLTREMLSYLRPAEGISAADYKKVLGKVALKDLKKGDVIDWEVISG